MKIFSIIFLILVKTSFLFCDPSYGDFLIEYHKSQEKRSDYSLLLYACSKGYMEIAKYRIEQGDNPNQLPRQNITCALAEAIRFRRADVVEKLLQRQANPNLKIGTKDSLTSPLLKAVELTDELQILKLLIDYGADVNDNTVFPPIFRAATSGNFEYYITLYRAGADLNRKCGNGPHDLRTIYHYLWEGKKPDENTIETAGKNKIIEHVFENKIDVNIHGTNVPSPLAICIQNLDVEMVYRLVEMGANTRDFYLAQYNELEKVSLLTGLAFSKGNFEKKSTIINILKSNVDVNMMSLYPDINFYNGYECKLFMNPIVAAVINRDYEFAEYLLKMGAKLDDYTLKGYLLKREPKLTSVGVTYTPLHLVIYVGDYDGVAFLLSNGADPDAQGEYNIHPVELALEREKFSDSGRSIIDLLHQYINFKHKY